jgi:methionyl-tRNA formyltransferase
MKITVHLMQDAELDSGNILVQKMFRITDRTTIADLNTLWLENAPGMFADALSILTKGKRGRKQDRRSGFRAYPRLPEYGKIDWTKSAREIHNLIRASTRPYSGAFTYMKVKGEVKKLFIWESRIIAGRTRNIGIPGHVVLNDSTTGESHIYTGKGILALMRAQYDGGEEFRPGREWKSIRMRCGIDVEEELIALRKLIQTR